MLGKGKQHKYVVKRWKSMIAHLQAYKDSQNPEELHKLRVDMKKIRALLYLYKNELDKEDLKPLKDLFKHTGKIRDAYIQLKLIEKYLPQHEEVKRKQEQLLTELSVGFSSKIETYSKDTQELYTKILEHLHNVKRGSVEEMYKKLRNKIDKILKEKDHSNLHTNRKRIKWMMYIYPLLGKKLSKEWKLNTHYLDKLQEEIGEWHDAITVVPSLTERGLSSEKIDLLINKRITQLEESIHTLSKDFRKKALK